MVAVLSVWCAIASAMLASPARLHIVDGMLNGAYVGTHTSELQANVIDKLYAPVPHGTPRDISLFNATNLRVLTLSGAYAADTSLRIPSRFVLELAAGASIVAAKNLSQANVSRFEGLVTLDDVWYSAVIGSGDGATIDASALGAIPWPPNATKAPNNYMAVAIVRGGRNAVRNLRLIANNTGSSVAVNESPNSEIAHCDIGGRSAEAMEVGRCVWTLATETALVHDNHIHHCTMHALDFDAFTSRSVAWSNLVELNGEEGIFIEESAHDNVVFNNTCRRNAGSGIGVYSNVVGPVAQNTIVANILLFNGGDALSAGGVAHGAPFPDKWSVKNVFAGNVAEGNGGGGKYPARASQFAPQHGGVAGDYWVGNSVRASGGGSAQLPEWDLASMPSNTSAVAIFEPERALLHARRE
jgi:parallel beta-helix repeat protein